METKKETNTKEDIIKVIDKECSGRNRIIDIDSGKGKMLFLAEKIGFRHLIGFDKNVCPHIGILKLKAKEANMEYVQYCTMVDCKLPNFLVGTSDYKDFAFEEFTYDCVILNLFLHFLPDDEKYKLIERLYQLMELGGVMAIKVNHNKHIIDTAPTHAVNISGNTWESINFSKERRYLVDVDEFITNLRLKYTMLEEHYLLNPERDILCLIKKIDL